MGAILPTVAAASAVRPKGPAATDKLPPKVKFPPIEKALTASAVFKTITKSVISAPI